MAETQPVPSTLDSVLSGRSTFLHRVTGGSFYSLGKNTSFPNFVYSLCLGSYLFICGVLGTYGVREIYIARSNSFQVCPPAHPSF